MAARIIPFPQLPGKGNDAPLSDMQTSHTSAASQTTKAHGLFLVRSETTAQTASTSGQQAAERIVEEICGRHNILHPSLDLEQRRNETFWSTLPIPPARTESPVAVARRVVRMMLPMVELA